jgi:hypothetical protein
VSLPRTLAWRALPLLAALASGHSVIAEAQPLGERSFAVTHPEGAFLVVETTGAAADWSAGPWQSDALRLFAGEVGVDGVAPLSLAADAVVAIPVTGGLHLCFQLRALGSEGFVDCDGGSAVDASFTQDSHGSDPAGAFLFAPGTADSGAGAALLGLDFAVTFTPGACGDVDFTGLPIGRGLLTTGRLETTVLNARQGGDVTLAVTGQGFSCARWRESTSGTFVGLPGNLFDVGGQEGPVDLVSALRLAGERASCPGDCDGDGTVDAADVGRIVVLFTLCPPCGGGAPAAGCVALPVAGGHCPAADRNGDGCISAAELTRVLADSLAAAPCP